MFLACGFIWAQPEINNPGIYGETIGVPKPSTNPAFLIGRSIYNRYYSISSDSLAEVLVDDIMNYIGSSYVGEGTFTTTAASDTTVISGALSTDTYIVSGKYVAGVDQQDVLQWVAKNDTLIVYRLANGESAAAYSYLRIPTP